MNFVQISVALASAATVLGAANLVIKAANKRIRLLAISVSLLTLCQMSTNASHLIGWNSVDLTRSLQILELTAGALSLAVIHLLNRENRDRHHVDSYLRVIEPLNVSGGLFRLAEQVGGSCWPANQRKALRFRMHAHTTLRLLDAPDKQVACEVRDISQSGVGLIAAEAVAERCPAEIELAGQIVTATIVRCQPAGFEFSIGLTFETKLARDRVADIVRNTHFCVERDKLALKRA